MKKLLPVIFTVILSFGLSANAEQNYILQQTGSGVQNNAQYKTYTDAKTCTDYIKVPQRQSQVSRIAMLSMIANDPYVVKIDNKKYYMVKTAPRGKYSVKNILGYHDKKSNMFNALSKLEKDGDIEKISRDELKKAKIRFVLLQPNGKLALSDTSKDFDMNRVEYIDMRYLRNTLNIGDIGTFGYFDLYIKDNSGKLKHITGLVTNEKDDELEALI